MPCFWATKQTLALSILQSYKPFPKQLSTCSFSLQKNKIHQSTEHQTADLEHQIAAEHIPVQSVVCLIKDTAPVKTALINTFAFPAKVSTPGPSAQEGGEIPPASVNSKAPIRPLMLKCEPSLPQVPLSMTSKSTLIYSEPSSPACSQIFDSICDLPSTSSLPTFPPEHDYLLEPRPLLIEYESNPSLDVASDEHSLTFDLAPFTQKTTLRYHPDTQPLLLINFHLTCNNSFFSRG